MNAAVSATIKTPADRFTKVINGDLLNFFNICSILINFHQDRHMHFDGLLSSDIFNSVNSGLRSKLNPKKIT